MSLFDVLNSPELKSALGSFASKAKTVASDVTQTPGGVGGLLGAGALGALLGSFVSKSVLKDAALVGAGAVAWNFYQKWSRNRNASNEETLSCRRGDVPSVPFPEESGTVAPDATAMLMLRAMVYTARADGHIDAVEQGRILKLVEQIFPGRDMSDVMNGLMSEPIDPARLAAEVRSPEQAEDLYRLSCLIVDVDHFMEKSYLDGLARVLHLSETRRTALEQEVMQARRQLLPG